jgi:hypothetical protein
MKKYFETFLVPVKFDSLGSIKHAESAQLDRFLDDITGSQSPGSTFYTDNSWNNPKFINLPPFFNNTLIADKFRIPDSNILVDYVYFHPDFAFLRNFTKKSGLQEILTTSSFRSLQDKPNFFETQINSISLNPDRLTTGRFIGEFINKFFLASPPPSPIVPSKLTASILADNAYIRAISTSINNSPFAMVSFDEFFYLLSGLDKTAPYQFSQYQISNLDYYKTLLKLNYIFHSHRQFKTVNRSEFKVHPIHLWYENLFVTYISRLLDRHFFNGVIPLHHRNVKRTFPIHKTKKANFLSTELYPTYELPQSFINSFQYISSPIYANSNNNFDVSFQKKVPVFFNFPYSDARKNKPNFFKLNFSQIFFYSWDFKSNRLVDNRTKFRKVSNYTETKQFKVYKELPNSIYKTNLEGDDLDRFFFLAYKNAKLSNFDRLPDSSTLLYNTLRWSTFESPNFRIYKNFTSIQSDFLHTFEFAFPFNKTSEAQLFQFINNQSPSTSPTFLRRYRHPFTTIAPRPHLRSIFQPSPRYRRFISFKNKFKRSHDNYPRSRRKKSPFFRDQSFIGNQDDVYFYFFDPTVSFNKEYSSYFWPKKSFKIANENFFDYVYTRRRLPFRKKYKLFDRIEKKDFVFKSRIRGHKSNPASRHVRLRTRKVYRYRHLKTDLTNKQTDHVDGYFGTDSKIDVGWVWQSGYVAWSYPFRYLAISIQGILASIISGPYQLFKSLLLTNDGFLTIAAHTIVFYFFDYVLLTIYVYFPGLLFFFDYTFFSFHFHVFHFWVIFFSVIFAIVGGYFLLTSSDFPKKFTFFQFFPFVFFYFAVETLLLLFGILFFTFTVINEKVIKSLVFLLFSFFLCLFGLNFFINFFLSFSRYNYIPSSHFFFNYPLWFQRFGCYKCNYYFQIWPNRFNFFNSFFSISFIFSDISKNCFKKSFFYTYTGNIKKRYFYHKKNFFRVYDLRNLDFPVPVFGPNIFSSYSYYQDKLNQTPLRLSPWDSNQDETIIDNDLNYQMSNLHDETDSALVTKQSYVVANKFAIHVTEDEHDNIESVAEADPDNPEPPSDDFLTESDFFVNVSEISGPNLKNQDLDDLDDPSFFSGKVNKAFFNKQKRPIEVSDVFMENEIEDIFDYERASHYEIYERDTLDRTFTSENSLGYWYSFHMSKSNKRVLPPTTMSLHSRPLDPLFTTNLLFPFLLSLKSYSDFENFPQFKLYSIQKCFHVFQISLDNSYFKNSFWGIYALVSILFFPIRFFFSMFSFLKRCFIKRHLFKKIFKKSRYFYLYYSFRKTFHFNLRFNVSFSTFFTYSLFYFFFSFINLFNSSKFITFSRQFSKSFILFYIFKNFKFLSHCFLSNLR